MHAAPSTAAWTVVVPVKRLESAKSRLDAYGSQARRALALAFAADVVRAARGAGAAVLVVTDDGDAAAAVAALGARVVPDEPAAGIDAALRHGAGCAGAGPVAALSADLPALRPDELAAALAQAAQEPRSFVADAAGTGTTLLAALRSADLAPSYGAGSADRHRATGAVELAAGPGLRCDVDRPEDLDVALALGVGPATAAVRARWCA